jgi:DNA-binding protein YbaB
MTDHRTQVAELVADYRRSREQLATMHKTLAAISVSATSSDGMVTATVGAQGRLTELVIDDAAYQRYRPADLAKLVVSITAQAAARVVEETSRTISPLLPTGTDPAALLAGTADLSAQEIAPEVPRRAAAHQDVDEESYEEHSWLDSADSRRAGQ